MSRAFVAPREPEDVVVDGVRFRVRALTAAERLPLAMGVVQHGNTLEFQAEAFRRAVRAGLMGWSVDDPAFSEDPDANLARLSDEALIAIGEHIINMSFVTPDEAGN